MAKRKRLAPAQPRDPNAPAIETKSMPGFSAPPIASVAGDASAVAALEELSETLRRARAEGRMITPIPLTHIDETYLVRDRVVVGGEDMDALKSSLSARGQQTPIEVVDLGEDRYGLISGWRRLQALRALGQDTAKAIITAPREAPDAYIAMIEENEIRVGLSYFERARIVVKAVEGQVFDSHKTALQSLFSTASRAKRSKIKSFIPVVQALGAHLKFPADLGERFGLQLSKALLSDPYAPRRMSSALAAAPANTAEEEYDTLDLALKQGLETEERPLKPKTKAALTRQISPIVGVQVSTSGRSITLKGHRVDPQLYNDLLQWLKNRG
jgi:ParB family transcriptional regulator, chromosome partitioning protein